MNRNQIVSIIIAFSLISFIVTGLPVFAENGHNYPLILTTIIFSFLCSGFLANWPFASLRRLLFRQAKANLLEPEVQVQIDKSDDDNQQQKIMKHHLLAYFLFTGYLAGQSWRIVNEVYRLIISSNCASSAELLYETSKLIFAIFLFLAMTSNQNRKESNSTLLYTGWLCTSAIAFNSAIQYVIGTVMFAFLEFWKNSGDSSFISESMLDNLVAVEACSHDTIIPSINISSLELIELFGTEYFFLSSAVCFLTWRKLDSNPEPVLDSENEKNEENNAAEDHVCTSSCSFSLSQRTALIGSAFFVIISLTFNLYFYSLMQAGNYIGGTWITVLHNLSIRSSIFVIEFGFYHFHLKHMKSASDSISRFELDIILGIFPLFPIGIFHFSLDPPHLIDIFTGLGLGMENTLLAIVESFYVLFQYAQVAYQGMFVSELLFTASKKNLKPARYIFVLLAVLNFILWVSYNFECQQRTILERSIERYGIAGSIIIIYSTLPFLLFNFAHVTTVFLELFKELRKY